MDRKILGRRSKVFDYTRKWIISLIEWRVKVTVEMQRVKKLRY